MFFNRQPSLRSLHKLLNEALNCWHSELKTFPERAKSLEAPLKRLDMALQEGNIVAARIAAPAISEHLKSRGGKLVRGFKELVITLIIALVFAGIARQTWFELYEIPTGSMRPTFKEGDRVLVSKTAFGVNVPFETAHLTFDPNRIQRGSITVITGDGIGFPNTDTLYFGIFPGKRRYVKRCVALPGDSIYFYGGNIYALSSDGSHVHIVPNDACPHLEYVPFTHFEGNVEVSHASRFGKSRTYTLKFFNQPLGKVTVFDNGAIESKIPNNSTTPAGWIEEFAEGPKKGSAPTSIGEFWGISNYAQARLLLPEQLPIDAKKLGYANPHALSYVELLHSPTLPQYAKGSAHDFNIPLITTCTSWVPLSERASEDLLNNLYTARFVVKNGKAFRYNEEGHFELSQSVAVPERIPNGTYEFYHGKAYSIGFGSYATELPAGHPIYPTNIEELQLFYNAGIEWHHRFNNPTFHRFPSRYAYFRDGSLCLLGHEILNSDDPILKEFETLEIARQSKDYSYFAFQDQGSPVDMNGGFDPEFFKNFGLKVPENHYILLGDNHAMSSDSRFVGPIPQQNIQGTTVLRFWPPQSRDDETTLGIPPQPHLNPSLSALVVAGVMIGSLVLGVAVIRRNRRKKLKLLRESS